MSDLMFFLLGVGTVLFVGDIAREWRCWRDSGSEATTARRDTLDTPAASRASVVNADASHMTPEEKQ